MQIDLTPDAERWVQSEIASGRSPTAQDAVHRAIETAKLTQLRAELAAAEAEGGAHSSDDVRAFAQKVLDEQAGGAPGSR